MPEIFAMKNSKKHTKSAKRDKGREDETEWYFVGGKWITAQQREVEIARIKSEIAKINETLAVCGQSWQSVTRLIGLAMRGDEPLPLHLLDMIAAEIIGALNAIAEKQPELLRPIARETFLWPALISRKRAFNRLNHERLVSLQLGKGQTFSDSEWQPAAASTHAAMVFMTVAQTLNRAGRLPPLTPEAKKQWFEASWASMIEHGLRPEENELLSPLGKSSIGKKSVSRGMPHQTEGMKRDDMRAEIKRRVWKAFDKLFVAGKQQKQSK